PPRVAALARVPALAPAGGRPPQPFPRTWVARHQVREPGRVRGIPPPDEAALVELPMLLLVARDLRVGSGNPIHPFTLYKSQVMQTHFHGLTFVTDPGRVFVPRATT